MFDAVFQVSAPSLRSSSTISLANSWLVLIALIFSLIYDSWDCFDEKQTVFVVGILIIFIRLQAQLPGTVNLDREIYVQ